MKRLFIALFLSLFASFSFISPVFGQDQKQVNIYFFRGEGCPHCAKEEIYLEKLVKKHPYIKVVDFEVWYNPENRKLLAEVGKKLNAEVAGVPFTVIGDKYLVGWYSEEASGDFIEKAVEDFLENDRTDVVQEVIAGKSSSDNTQEKIIKPQADKSQTNLEELKMPILGTINVKKYSLPAITVILGVLDGFNPCAMWALLFLITLLLGMKNRARMWILGSAFIITSAFVYFMFMAAWLNLLLFIGFIFWVRFIIGLAAITAGGYNLREYWKNKDGACKVTGSEKRQKFFSRLKKIAYKKEFLLALGGIILLAFAVNTVELICSAGFPVIFTQILTLSNLPVWQYYAYLLLYIFFFMIDDLLVFFAAMITLQATGFTTKYVRWSHLIGGILMLLIGLLLIFKPELLMFG